MESIVPAEMSGLRQDLTLQSSRQLSVLDCERQLVLAGNTSQLGKIIHSSHHSVVNIIASFSSTFEQLSFASCVNIPLVLSIKQRSKVASQ